MTSGMGNNIKLVFLSCQFPYAFSFVIQSRNMRNSLKQKIIRVCNSKIKTKGPKVGLSLYAFFANKNDDPELLMEMAVWWIKTHRLDHFEKAVKIKNLAEND